MRRIRSKITYANVVATLALFIALGGVSYAAVKLPANSVGEKQLKKNSVTNKKIKKNAITGDKIKNGTIQGADISLGSLGTVANATHANSADNSATTNQVDGVAKRVQSSYSGTNSQDDSRSHATVVPLASNGQVSIYGKCYTYSNVVYADVFSSTTANGALATQYQNSYYGSSGYLNSGTPESQREIMSYISVSNNSASNSYYQYGNGSLFGPDGNGLNFQIYMWAKQGTPLTYQNGAYGDGSVCVFNASAIKLAAGS